jgi:1,2-diacylglycerol 3-alpha-glucosyltransferase
MKTILVLNSILRTAQNNVIPQTSSIKDCMIYSFALGFKELEYSVTLVAAAEYAPTEKETYGVETVFIVSKLQKIFPPSVLPFQPGLWHFLRKNKEKYDLIVSSEVFAFPSLFAAMLCSRKTVIWHELAVHQKKMKSLPSRFWYNVVAKLFFRKIPVVPRSEDARKFVSKYLSNVSNESVEHGIDLKKFQFSREKKKQFIVVGQLIPRKNIKSIIDKFQLLVSDNNYSDFQLIIAGEGKLEGELKKQTVALGMENNVDFVGFKPHSELNKLIAESVAMLIDTKQDNNMVSIPESIVSGTPVITNPVPTNATTVNQHRSGIVKTDWKVADLKEMIENNAFYIQNCLAYRSNLSNVYCAKKLIDIYEDTACQ